MVCCSKERIKKHVCRKWRRIHIKKIKNGGE
jgi:hypothetical protein